MGPISRCPVYELHLQDSQLAHSVSDWVATCTTIEARTHSLSTQPTLEERLLYRQIPVVLDACNVRPTTRLRGPTCGFTLIELVIVILVLSILAAVGAPRLLSISADAEEAALTTQLSIMRDALDYYATQHHGKYPASLTALTKYTSENGAMSGNKTAHYKYGKYLREMPACPTGTHKGATGWGACANPPAGEAGAATIGWLYHAASGGVWVNDGNHLDK